ncbi:hypothetical protein WISP_15131 [Willisornis vidua]|uniref:Uncharacterized protein n=1 Tax=Willisornis vidua TaxID=1566151 RepID=A0ABQ9DUH8_9PASS|nr:hypothetical protein WISP_15131 [Willisornis vidua]
MELGPIDKSPVIASYNLPSLFVECISKQTCALIKPANKPFIYEGAESNPGCAGKAPVNCGGITSPNQMEDDIWGSSLIEGGEWDEFSYSKIEVAASLDQNNGHLPAYCIHLMYPALQASLANRLIDLYTLYCLGQPGQLSP